MRIRHIVLSSVAYSPCTKFLDIAQLLSETFLILRRIKRDSTTNVHSPSRKMPARYSCQILIQLEFSRQIFLILKYESSRKSVQWKPSCSMQRVTPTDGRTDRHDEANSRFSQFCERAPKTLCRFASLCHLQQSNPRSEPALAVLTTLYYLV
jgi:hypothetical protein